MRRALLQVRASNHGVLDVAKCIPLKCRIAMLSRFQTINEHLEELIAGGLYVAAARVEVTVLYCT